jgi:hypothetical protein
LSAVTAPAAEHVTPRNAQCGAAAAAVVLACHDGRRMRWDGSGREARKESRTAVVGGGVTEVAGCNL